MQERNWRWIAGTKLCEKEPERGEDARAAVDALVATRRGGSEGVDEGFRFRG